MQRLRSGVSALRSDGKPPRVALRLGNRPELPALFLGTEGTVAVRDGETELARLPMQLTVLP